MYAVINENPASYPDLWTCRGHFAVSQRHRDRSDLRTSDTARAWPEKPS